MFRLRAVTEQPLQPLSRSPAGAPSSLYAPLALTTPRPLMSAHRYWSRIGSRMGSRLSRRRLSRVSECGRPQLQRTQRPKGRRQPPPPISPLVSLTNADSFTRCSCIACAAHVAEPLLPGTDNQPPSSPLRSFAGRPPPAAAAAATAGRSLAAIPPQPIQSLIRRRNPPRRPGESPRPEDDWLWPRHQLHSAGDPCVRLHSESGCRGAPRSWHCHWMRTLGSKRGLSCIRFQAHQAAWNAIERMLRRSMPDEPGTGSAAAEASDAADRSQSAFNVMSAAASAEQTNPAQFTAADEPTRTNQHKRPNKQAEGEWKSGLSEGQMDDC